MQQMYLGVNSFSCSKSPESAARSRALYLDWVGGAVILHTQHWTDECFKLESVLLCRICDYEQSG
jgi:hypothetical protein